MQLYKAIKSHMYKTVKSYEQLYATIKQTYVETNHIYISKQMQAP